MKTFVLLFLLAAASFTSCSKSKEDETCKPCTMTESWPNTIPLKQKHTDLGVKCGDDLSAIEYKTDISDPNHHIYYHCP